MADTHFFSAEGAPCGASDVARYTVIQETVTCSTCAELLQVREREQRERRVRGRRVLARLRARRIA